MRKVSRRFIDDAFDVSVAITGHQTAGTIDESIATQVS
jgi:hypothetical protein